MNMFQLQERIKDFSKDQLVQEMQQPSGAVPPFLVLSELQRRTRMEQAFNTDMAQQGQQTTVAQDAVAAAGVPQAGIAGLAQNMAPQTDMAQNTGVAAMAPQAPAPVQGMYGGGEVKRMQPGGEVEGPNTARLRELLSIYRGLGDVRRDFEVQAARERRVPSGLAAIEPRVIPLRDEFSGLPADMTDSFQLPELVIDREPTPPTLVDPSEFAGLPPDMTDPTADQGEPYTRVADLFGLGPAIDRIPSRAPMDPRSDLQVPEGGIAALLPPPASTLTLPVPGGPQAVGEGGGAGGAGGAGGSRGALNADRMMEQDKWLALAQFGLGLMASQAPTLGGAIGEAGTAALGQLGEARKAAVERDLAERTLAARTAGAGRDRGALTANQALSAINDQIQATNMALALTSSADERMRLTDQLTLLREQAAGIMAASGFGPATAAALEAGVDLDLAG